MDANSAKSKEPDRFDGIILPVAKDGSMGIAERREVVLRFMAHHELALKPMTVYRNLRFHRRITFTDETVKNILHELVDEGMLMRVDPNGLEDAELIEIGRGEGRGAYLITDTGREYLQSE